MENPIVPGAAVVPDGEIDVSKIIRLYKKRYGMDVGRFFGSLEKIKIYRCEKTGYRFFHPFSLAGDGKFYEQLQKFRWYYMPWKWEHQLCADLIEPGQKILEVGCGQGDFLLNLRKLKEVKCVGLELNESSKSRHEDVQISHVPVEEFSRESKEAFDVVCSFQVLEHVPNVKSFLDAKIECLKKGGLLVISVPNDDSFISKDQNNILNMPPHHMGLWTADVFKNLEKYFPIKLKNILLEPLQPYHFDWYINLMAVNYIGYYPSLVLGKLLLTFLRNPLAKNLAKKAEDIPGHSIAAVYVKS